LSVLNSQKASNQWVAEIQKTRYGPTVTKADRKGGGSSGTSATEQARLAMFRTIGIVRGRWHLILVCHGRRLSNRALLEIDDEYFSKKQNKPLQILSACALVPNPTAQFSNGGGEI
jgi:hypothetical protein